MFYSDSNLQTSGRNGRGFGNFSQHQFISPKEGPVRYNCHGSLVVENELVQNMLNEHEGDTHAETVVVRNIVFLYFSLC